LTGFFIIKSIHPSPRWIKKTDLGEKKQQWSPALICRITLSYDQVHFQTRTATSSFAWFTRNNRYESANTGRSHMLLLIAYVDTIVGMRLDQRSYWISWKLVGRLWRYQHEMWL